MITDGVFFHPPGDVPRGRPPIRSDQIAGIHRERLMIAATSLLGSAGYRGASATAIAGYAHASLGTFYDYFNDRDDCLLAAYDRFLTVMSERIVRAARDHHETQRAFDHAATCALDVLDLDRVAARAFLLEIDALGVRARTATRAAITGFIARLCAVGVDTGPSPELAIATCYTLRALAANHLETSPDEPLALLPRPLLASMCGPTTASPVGHRRQVEDPSAVRGPAPLSAGTPKQRHCAGRVDVDPAQALLRVGQIGR